MKYVKRLKQIPYLGITVIVITLLVLTLFSFHNVADSNKKVYFTQANQAYEKRIDCIRRRKCYIENWENQV